MTSMYEVCRFTASGVALEASRAPVMQMVEGATRVMFVYALHVSGKLSE